MEIHLHPHERCMNIESMVCLYSEDWNSIFNWIYHKSNSLPYEENTKYISYLSTNYRKGDWKWKL